VRGVDRASRAESGLHTAWPDEQCKLLDTYCSMTIGAELARPLRQVIRLLVVAGVTLSLATRTAIWWLKCHMTTPIGGPADVNKHPSNDRFLSAAPVWVSVPCAAAVVGLLGGGFAQANTRQSEEWSHFP
jgi:hypothetical protein